MWATLSHFTYAGASSQHQNYQTYDYLFHLLLTYPSSICI
ncbi:hypothetical protein YPPY66_2715 [Yersinia pestis PY-66]|uniref:Uncharacterized protein n=2 Tax=Yersinia pestis TaxID=632 RepID=A0AAV3BF96_YERPE|nr:hypothetical protein YpAngola_A2379 [Yersinia pestis Angola]EDR31329.1 hypothetical protein YPIP275_1725 [Yersinia pestis biovar Orientalis str. IP275]EDR44030.1 hypothetical protein YpE1979001_0503 [Yersinia pestis biovar Antiqua str. E1979001]EDR52399.1 hypothetical protein YpB42003004_1524 [Yersinia pestis biovar Antiqua str. B42003004]EDR57707.1 hypothetical protein YpMG051020_3300 [Yersinia pestis biovar Orientalis str. MG05-1020]EDR64251.1 hypothetical protein YpK1973002_0388 [Yersini